MATSRSRFSAGRCWGWTMRSGYSTKREKGRRGEWEKRGKRKKGERYLSSPFPPFSLSPALHVTQPHILASGLESREPPAQRVERQYHANPNGIHRPQPESECLRVEQEEHPQITRRRLPGDGGRDQCEAMDEVQVDNVVEERHPPVDHEEANQRPGRTIHQSKQHERRPQRHEEVQQRRWILAGVEK